MGLKPLRVPCMVVGIALVFVTIVLPLAVTSPLAMFQVVPMFAHKMRCLYNCTPFRMEKGRAGGAIFEAALARQEILEEWRWEDWRFYLLGLVVLLVIGVGVLFWLKRRSSRKHTTAPLSASSASVSEPAAAKPSLELPDVQGGKRTVALIPEGLTIGRDADNGFVVTADVPGWETVSRHHARIYAWQGRWVVEDLGSANGTYVNGQRTGHNVLRDGWDLSIGGVRCVFWTGDKEMQE